MKKPVKNRDLILAYDELLEFELHDLSYWKDKLYATKLQEEQASAHAMPENKKITLGTRKRNHNVEPRDPFRWFDDGKDDDEGSFLTSNPVPIKVKKEGSNTTSQAINTMSQAENDALYEDPDYSSQSDVSRPKRAKHNLSSQSSTRPTPSVRSSSTVVETE